ncbi:hypothetical protein BDY19DRAFT_626553 [Irpex rosettiformis]|uniref:Uncharacterized protein n=1 Tax=Irpex rosettiformis TaxID=378272 RepID=A0ACB8UBI6_9APHY|nr:hypothetical protein BDY19DRAFT_626553 [Irpex rosettiformis]
MLNAPCKTPSRFPIQDNFNPGVKHFEQALAEPQTNRHLHFKPSDGYTKPFCRFTSTPRTGKNETKIPLTVILSLLTSSSFESHEWPTQTHPCRILGPITLGPLQSWRQYQASCQSVSLDEAKRFPLQFIVHQCITSGVLILLTLTHQDFKYCKNNGRIGLGTVRLVGSVAPVPP